MENKEIADPQFILVLGGVCTGKSHFIDQNYKSGYVQIDAGKIFIFLSQGKFYDFPSILEEQMNEIGLDLTTRALSKKSNIVMEMIGDKGDEISELTDSLKSIGYHVNAVFIDCDVEIAIERNANRSDDNISAVYTQPFHIKWLNEAIKRIAASEGISTE